MRLAILIVILSLVGVALGLMVPGYSELLFLAVPGGTVGLILLLRSLPLWRWTSRRNWILLDGSNILYWNGNTPRIETLHEVVRDLERRGFDPCVVFDANAGYLVSGAYRGDMDMATQLGLPPERVMVVPKGTVADRFILDAARDLGARVVTNDRYRDWASDFPEVREKGRLIRGGYRADRLWLEELGEV